MVNILSLECDYVVFLLANLICRHPDLGRMGLKVEYLAVRFTKLFGCDVSACLASDDNVQNNNLEKSLCQCMDRTTTGT